MASWLIIILRSFLRRYRRSSLPVEGLGNLFCLIIWGWNMIPSVVRPNLGLIGEKSRQLVKINHHLSDFMSSLTNLPGTKRWFVVANIMD